MRISMSSKLTGQIYIHIFIDCRFRLVFAVSIIKVVLENENVQRMLGEPIRGFGEPLAGTHRDVLSMCATRWELTSTSVSSRMYADRVEWAALHSYSNNYLYH